MGFFRKRAAVVEAEQLRWDNWSRVCEFVGVPEQGYGIEDDFPEIAMVIHTLRGDRKASEGDWIVRDMAGDIYPCKPGVFALVFEEVAAGG